MLPRRTLLKEGGVLIRGRCRCCWYQMRGNVTNGTSISNKRIHQQQQQPVKEAKYYPDDPDRWTVHPFLRVDQVETLALVFREENAQLKKSLSTSLVHDDNIQRRMVNTVDTTLPISAKPMLDRERRKQRIKIFSDMTNLIDKSRQHNDKDVYEWFCNLFAMRTVQEPYHRLCLDTTKVALIHLAGQGRIDLCLSLLEAYWLPLTSNTSLSQDSTRNPLKMTLVDSLMLVKTLIYHYVQSPTTPHSVYHYDQSSEQPTVGCNHNQTAVETVQNLIDRLVQVFNLERPPLALLPIQISALCCVGTLEQAVAKLYELHNVGAYLPSCLLSQSILATIEKQRRCFDEINTKPAYSLCQKWYTAQIEPILRELRGYFISPRASCQIYAFLISNCIYTYRDLFGILDLINANEKMQHIPPHLQVPLIKAVGDTALGVQGSSSDGLVQLFGLISRLEKNMYVPLTRRAQIETIVQAARLGGTRATKKRLEKFINEGFRFESCELRKILKVVPSKASTPADQEWFESRLWTGPRRSIHMNARGYARQQQLDFVTARLKPIIAEVPVSSELVRSYIACLGRFRQVRLILEEWQSPTTKALLQQQQQRPEKRDQIVVSFVSALLGAPDEAWQLALDEFDKTGRVGPRIIKSLFQSQNPRSPLTRTILTFLLVDPRVTQLWTSQDFEIAIPSSRLLQVYRQLAHLMKVDDDPNSMDVLLQQVESWLNSSSSSKLV